MRKFSPELSFFFSYSISPGNTYYKHRNNSQYIFILNNIYLQYVMEFLTPRNPG